MADVAALDTRTKPPWLSVWFDKALPSLVCNRHYDIEDECRQIRPTAVYFR